VCKAKVTKRMENKRRKLDASSFAIVDDVLRIFKRCERNRKDEDGDE
jgi:hypothetical protein